MHPGKTVFSQLTDFIPRQEFRQIVKRYKGEHCVRRFSCWDQLLSWPTRTNGGSGKNGIWFALQS